MSNLKAIKRENTSSGSNNKLRADGFVPAILYGGKDPNQNISIEKKAIKNIINSDTFLSKVLELDIDGKKEKVIPRDVAFHVVSEEPIHIDFMRIVAGKNIILEIPVKFINHPDSPGLKRGGVLNIVRRKVELKCPGENIPDDIFMLVPMSVPVRSIVISSGIFSAGHFNSTFLLTMFNTPPLFNPGESEWFLNWTGISIAIFDPETTLIKSICIGSSETTW